MDSYYMQLLANRDAIGVWNTLFKKQTNKQTNKQTINKQIKIASVVQNKEKIRTRVGSPQWTDPSVTLFRLFPPNNMNK